jgi:ATPase family associated with various cellular activities (AAA)
LKIAKHFNAILLLDEADSFMASRTALNDNHNRLVTIFLRKLEYYQGILFLTSNRGAQFDDAILSRIHLTIEYENLTRYFRRDLWSTFLSKACTMQGPALVEEHDLRRLEYLALNGREVGSRVPLLSTSHLLTAIKIKNIAAIAHALAEADASQVSYKYLEFAAKSNKKFSKEFGRDRPVNGMYV